MMFSEKITDTPLARVLRVCMKATVLELNSTEKDSEQCRILFDYLIEQRDRLLEETIEYIEIENIWVKN